MDSGALDWFCFGFGLPLIVLVLVRVLAAPFSSISSLLCHRFYHNIQTLIYLFYVYKAFHLMIS
jgi:hypothetical protein